MTPNHSLDRVTIEPMTYWDLEQVTAIERAAFRRPWKPGGFRTEMERKPSICLVLRDGFTVLGYLIFWVIPPEIHILNIAVHSRARGRGLGSLLMDYLTEYARESKIELIHLEVRPSNAPAIALYKRSGFQLVGRRKNYYVEDKEDALLMTLELSPVAPTDDPAGSEARKPAMEV